MLGNGVLFQFLISLERHGCSVNRCPCTFEDLSVVIYDHTRVDIELLVDVTTIFDSLSARWDDDWKNVIGQITVNLPRHLMMQCPHCSQRVAKLVLESCQSGQFPLDHNTKLFKKLFKLSDFIHHKRDGMCVLVIINEQLKIRQGVCTKHHESGDALVEYHERMERELVLRYDRMTDWGHMTLPEILKIKEIAQLIVNWDRKGAWCLSGVPKVPFEYFAVYLWKVFGICISDVFVLTKKDYQTVERNTRAGNVTDMITNVAIKLTGRCLQLGGCNECFLNLKAIEKTGIENNHKDPGKKKDCLCKLKWNIWKWFEEAERGDCDPICSGCHQLITAYQHTRMVL